MYPGTNIIGEVMQWLYVDPVGKAVGFIVKLTLVMLVLNFIVKRIEMHLEKRRRNHYDANSPERKRFSQQLKKLQKVHPDHMRGVHGCDHVNDSVPQRERE